MLNALLNLGKAVLPTVGKAVGTAALTRGIQKGMDTIFGDGSKQNKKNIKAQLDASKELTDYNLQKQLELWEKTNYDEQRKQMEKAGLSVSLMHNLGGAGGTTAIQPGGMPTTDTYSQMLNARTAQTQLAMQQSQIELNKAQKKKIEAEADNIKEDTTQKGFDNEIRAIIGTKAYAENVDAQLSKEYVQNRNEYRKARELWFALNNGKGLATQLDKFGAYAAEESGWEKIAKIEIQSIEKQFEKLKTDINKTNQDIKESKQRVSESKANEELLKIEKEILDFKENLTDLGINETTVKILELFLKAMISGRR